MNLFSCLLNILQRSSFELIIISPNKTINKFIGWWKGGRKINRLSFESDKFLIYDPS